MLLLLLSQTLQVLFSFALQHSRIDRFHLLQKFVGTMHTETLLREFERMMRETIGEMISEVSEASLAKNGASTNNNQ